VGDSESHTLESESGQATEEQRRALAEAIENHGAELLRDARVYVSMYESAGDIQTIAEDAYQDALATAVRIASRFDTSRAARPWLRSIIHNQARTACKKRRTERKYILPVSDAARGAITREDDPSEHSEAELFGLLGATSDGADHSVEDDVEDILALVSESDREVLHLSVCEGLQGAELAARLGTTTGAAYVRKCRAIDRLRAAYERSNGGREGT
jgi:RNA polymerase sigma factor (sigma-70 family)